MRKARKYLKALFGCLAIAVISIFGLSAGSAFAVGEVSHWSPLGIGMDGEVNALALGPDGILYAGGKFTKAGGKTVNHIAKWDGKAWWPLGAGTDSEVSALAVAPDGTLYAGGDFSMAGGKKAENIAKWNGTAWSALGNSPTSPNQRSMVTALAVSADGVLYAAGWFEQAGGKPANNIARWDGSAWSSLGSGLDRPIISGGLAIGPDGSLYVAGDFGSAGETDASGIAKWDGTKWSSISPRLEADRRVSVSAISFDSGGSLYAGGDFEIPKSKHARNIAKWSAGKWTALGAGTDNSVTCMAFARDGTLYAGGFFQKAGGKRVNTIAKWNGSAWMPLGSGMAFTPGGQSIVYALVVAPDGTVYAGGQFLTAGGVRVNAIASWK